MIGRLRLDRKNLLGKEAPGGVVSTHGALSSFKSAVRAESRAAWNSSSRTKRELWTKYGAIVD